MALTANLRGAILGIAGFALYALYDITIKYLAGSYSPLQVLFVAVGLALPLILLPLLREPGPGRLWPVLPGWMALRVTVALSSALLGAYVFATLPLAEAYAVFFAMPLMIAALGVPLLGERMDLRRALAILAGLCGVIVVLRPGQVPLMPGHLAAMAAATLGAMNYVILRKTGQAERPVVMLFWPLAGQWLVTGLAMPFVWQPMPLPDLGLCMVMAVTLVLGGSVIIAAYRAAPVIVVAPMQYSQIIWAVLAGTLLFGEAIDLQTIIGIGIIIGSGLVILTHRTPAENRV